jgi:hypothetical protein
MVLYRRPVAIMIGPIHAYSRYLLDHLRLQSPPLPHTTELGYGLEQYSTWQPFWHDGVESAFHLDIMTAWSILVYVMDRLG